MNRSVPNSAAEIAYEQTLSALDGQAVDLANIRGHMNIILTASGIAATFLGAQTTHRHGWPFLVAGAAFAVIVAVTIAVYWPVSWVESNDGYALVADYVDAEPPWTADAVMRELAIHATDDYRQNRQVLDRLFNLQSLALVFFGVEMLGLLVAVWRR